MNKRRTAASIAFNRFLKLTLGTYLIIRFRISAVKEGLSGLKPPYILLANHPGFWDPFIVSLYVAEPIQFVASDEYFRNPLLKFLLALVGAIPKSKFISDHETVKEILRVKRKNGVIGIFPEGKRTWDGRTMPVLYPTSKLVKKLGIPLITVKIKGGFLSSPRWADSSRRGHINLIYRHALTEDQIADMTVDRIHTVITEHLAHNEYEYQKKNMIPYRGKNPAQTLELFLFTCPCCKRMDTLKSKSDRFFCSCGLEAALDTFGFLKQIKGKLLFPTPLEWNDWQQQNLKEILLQAPAGSPSVENSPAVLETGMRLIRFGDARQGSLALFPDKLTFREDRKDIQNFELKGIKGLNIQYNDRFEFYYGRRLYRFSFPYGTVSAFKWKCAIEILIRYQYEIQEGDTPNEL